jgi:hypothetical protein
MKYKYTYEELEELAKEKQDYSWSKPTKLDRMVAQYVFDAKPHSDMYTWRWTRRKALVFRMISRMRKLGFWIEIIYPIIRGSEYVYVNDASDKSVSWRQYVKNGKVGVAMAIACLGALKAVEEYESRQVV